MLHRPFTFASILSLLACAATLVFWVRSYWVGDSFFAQTPDAIYAGSIDYGRASVHRLTAGSYRRKRMTVIHTSVRPPQSIATSDSIPGSLGFHYEKRVGVITRTSVVVPLWFVTLAALLLPSLRIAASVRRRQINPH